jgi:hypothetical protein
VLQYNGVKVEGLDLSRLVRETPVGREAKLDIFRNGAPLTLIAKVGERPRAPWHARRIWWEAPRGSHIDRRLSKNHPRMGATKSHVAGSGTTEDEGVTASRSR